MDVSELLSPRLLFQRDHDAMALEPHVDGLLAVSLLFGVILIPPLVRVRMMYTACWLSFTMLSHVIASDAALGIATTMGITIMVGWYTLRIFDRYAFTALLNGWLGVWATSPVLGLMARMGDFVIHMMLPMVLIACYLPLVRVWMCLPALVCSRIWCYVVVGGGMFPKADHIYRFSPPRSQHFWNAAYKMELLLNLVVPLFCVLARQRSFWVYVMTAVIGALLVTVQMLRSMSLPSLQTKAKAIMCRLLVHGGISPSTTFVVRDDALWLDWMSEGLLAIGESYVGGLWDVHSNQPLDEVITGLMTIPMEARQEMYRSWSARCVALAARLFNYQSSSKALMVGPAHEQFDLNAEFRRTFMDKYCLNGFGLWVDGVSDIERAQQQKLESLQGTLAVQPGDRILDLCIGSSGGVGCYLAERNESVSVVTVLTSNHDLIHAKRLATEQGVLERMEFVVIESPEKLMLYLTSVHSSQFDRIVSSGLVETIPSSELRRFLRALKRIHKSEGAILLDAVTCPSPRVPTHAWNNRYIHGNFPCHPLTLPRLRQDIIESGFDIEEISMFSTHMEQTLLEWNRRFQRRWGKDRQVTSAQTLPKSFQRTWEFHLLHQAACFRAQALQLYQFRMH